MRKTLGELFIEYERCTNIVTRWVIRGMIADRLDQLERDKL